MPLQKNQILTLRIERLSSDGSGVAHSADGEAVFVPGTAPGDEARVRIVKDCGRYAFGILDELLTPSPDRIPVDCPVAGPCGGCSLRHLDYAAELRAKQENVTDAFRRIGGLEVPVLDILPSPEVDRYRNKVQFPVGRDKNGAPCIGFYAGRTHRIVPCPDCKLQPDTLNAIGNALCSFFAANGIQPYDEASGKGLVRHIFLRRGVHSGQIMVCLVCTRAKLPHSDALVEQLTAQFPDIATILVNVNAKNTNVILGSETHTLYGPGFIEDTLCGVPVRLGPLSFYQVNTLAAERLYGIAADYAILCPKYSLTLDREMTTYTGLVTLVQLSAGILGDRNRMSYDAGISYIRNVFEATRTLQKNPDDLDARGIIMMGASLSTSSRLGIGKEEPFAYEIYELEFLPERLFGSSYRRSLTSVFPRFLQAMGKHHADDIRKYYHDAFGFDSSIEESSRKLVKLFEGLGVEMYYDGKITREQVDAIPCHTELSKEEVFDIINSLIR